MIANVATPTMPRRRIPPALTVGDQSEKADGRSDRSAWRVKLVPNRGAQGAGERVGRGVAINPPPYSTPGARYPLRVGLHRGWSGKPRHRLPRRLAMIACAWSR